MLSNSILQIFYVNTQPVRLYIPDATAHKLSVHSPYWAKVWPASLGLCHFLDNNLHYVQQKTVTELAAGLGLCTIFAAKFAANVYSSDIEPAAVELIEQSVQYNRYVNVRCKVKSWNDCYGDIIPDTLLLSDVNYEPEQFEALYQMVHYFLEHKCTVIISTPQRLMAKSFMEKLLPFCMEQDEVLINEKGTETAISIFVLQLKKEEHG
jgi:predicted nicotinamide N-methyase